ncbi:MAG: response regulator transcription factor [Bacteroidia bacterium]
MIQIALADDETLFRKGMRILIESFDGMKIILEAGNGKELLAQLATLNSLPDILLLDLNMPEMNGVETAKALSHRYPEIRIIVLSSFFTKAFILNMIEIGASGYLPKNSMPEAVETAIREVYSKGFAYNDKVLEVMRDSMVKRSKPKISFTADLSEREKEVLQLICEQYTAAEIADKLFISIRTVDGHRNNLLQKLNCRNTAGLVVCAIQNELVDISPNTFLEGK